MASGNYVGAAVDAFGLATGVAGIGLKASADARSATESSRWNRGWMQPWAGQRAAEAAGLYRRFSFGAFAAGSAFGPLLNPAAATGVKPSTAGAQ